jgi:diguanylate cyclase (GGDEF)-like protein
MYTALYIEINILSFIILFWILRKLTADANGQMTVVLFKITTAAVMAIILLDIAWALIDGKRNIFLFYANNIINSLYMILTGCIPLCWLIYSQYAHCKQYRMPHILFAFIILPQVALTVLCVMSPWTGWIFTVDYETNKYGRGPYIWIQELITYSYYLYPTIRISIQLMREKSTFQRQLLTEMMLFLVFPFIGLCCSFFFTGLPLAWPPATLSILMIFMNMQNSQILTDSLTGLNNRRRYEEYIKQVKSGTHKDELLFLFIIDITHLNKINEAHGHAEGDNALIDTANVLRQNMRRRNAFLSRYGGDEFVILLQAKTEKEAEQLEEQIYDSFSERNKTIGVKFPINVSVNYRQA